MVSYLGCLFNIFSIVFNSLKKTLQKLILELNYFWKHTIAKKVYSRSTFFMHSNQMEQPHWISLFLKTFSKIFVCNPGGVFLPLPPRCNWGIFGGSCGASCNCWMILHNKNNSFNDFNIQGIAVSLDHFVIKSILSCFIKLAI